MNNAQRLLVIIALVGIAIVLPWLMLHWGTRACIGCEPILIFYEYEGLGRDVGIYTAFATPPILAVLFGVVLPLCLFAVAMFLALGTRKTNI
jgi:hypothetical protein